MTFIQLLVSHDQWSSSEVAYRPSTRVTLSPCKQALKRAHSNDQYSGTTRSIFATRRTLPGGGWLLKCSSPLQAYSLSSRGIQFQ